MARKDPISHLGRHRDALPDNLLREVLAQLPRELPRIQALALDPAAFRGEEPAATLAWHAVRILGTQPDPRGHETLLQVLDAVTDSSTPLFNMCALQLMQRAKGLAEPLFARIGRPQGDAALDALVLGGVKDDRLVPLVEDFFRRDKRGGIWLIQALGDARLAPVVEREVERILALAEPTQEELDPIEPLVSTLGELGVMSPGLANRAVARLQSLAAQAHARREQVEAQMAMLSSVLKH